MVCLEGLVSKKMKVILEYVYEDEVNNKAFQTKLNEFLKFIYIMSEMKPGTFIPVNNEIDDIWHTFILQTLEYEKLCACLPGSRFINHETIPFRNYTKKEENEDFIVKSLLWLKKYHTYFGEWDENTIIYWGMANDIKNYKKLSFSEFKYFSLSLPI